MGGISWAPLIISICGSFFSVIILGTLVALVRRFFTSIDQKLTSLESGLKEKADKLGKDIEQIKSDIQGIMLEGAQEAGSLNTRFALLERESKLHTEQLIKLEGSHKRLWSRVDPEPDEERGRK